MGGTELEPGCAIRATRKALANIDRWNPYTNALLTALPDEALATANALDVAAESGAWQGLIHGMTISLKDNIDLEGIPTTGGSNILQNNRAACNAFIVERLKENGAVIIGKANLHEWAFGPTSQSEHFGPCLNPWNLEHIPGGSSGGSGVSVATGMCVGSIGSDTGGSVRIPAAFNGVAGLRPTIGRISSRGSIPVSPAFDTLGPLARRVVDIARIFTVIAGFDQNDPNSVRRSVPNILPSLHGSLKGCRLGIMRRFFFEHLDPDLAEAMEHALQVFRELEVEIVDIDLGEIEETSAKMAFGILLADAYEQHREHFEHQREEYGRDVRARLDMGARVTGADYANAMRWMEGWRQRLGRTFLTVDAILSPTAPAPAPTIAEIEDLSGASRHNITRFTFAWAFAGVPALVVPCGFTKTSLPLSMQIAGPWFDELTLFKLGHAFQSATDYHLASPPEPLD